MNPFLTDPEQLARARAADWARIAEQRRLARLATCRDASDPERSPSLAPSGAGRLSRWADRVRTVGEALVGGAVRSAHGAPK